MWNLKGCYFELMTGKKHWIAMPAAIFVVSAASCGGNSIDLVSTNSSPGQTEPSSTLTESADVSYQVTPDDLLVVTGNSWKNYHRMNPQNLVADIDQSAADLGLELTPEFAVGEETYVRASPMGTYLYFDQITWDPLKYTSYITDEFGQNVSEFELDEDYMGVTFSWSPDESAFLYSTGMIEQAFIYDLEQGVSIPIGIPRLSDRTELVFDSAWSPDGTQLFFAVRNENDKGDLYIYSRASGELQRLTTQDEWWYLGPEWSPDGRHLAVIRSKFGTHELALITPEGSVVATMATSEEMYFDGAYDWSPDGSKFAFGLYEENSRDLVIFDVETQDAQMIVEMSDGYWVRELEWLPDGEALVFSRVNTNNDFEDREEVVFKTAEDGTGVTQLDVPPSSDWYSSFSLSPSGRYLLLSQNIFDSEIFDFENGETYDVGKASVVAIQQLMWAQSGQ